MRIIGYIEHPVMKITVFKMDDKFTVKFETGLYEQSYKFRGSSKINGLESIKKIVDQQFTEEVLREFKSLYRIKEAALIRFLEAKENESFDNIV